MRRRTIEFKLLLCLIVTYLGGCGPSNTPGFLFADQPSLDPFDRPTNISHTIRVMAIDGATGEVIRHAPLECQRYGDASGKLMRVDSLNQDGSSSFTTSLAGNYKVNFNSQGLFDLGYNCGSNESIVVDTSGYPADFVIDVTIQRLKCPDFMENDEDKEAMIGLALAEDGTPVAGAKIVFIDDFHSIHFPGLPSGNLETNEDGKITVPPSSFHGNIFYLRNGDLFSKIMDGRYWRGSWEVPARIFMRPQAVLSGNVTDGESKPMPGIVVRAWLDSEFSNTLSRHTMTDTEGRYYIDGLPPAKYKTAIFRGKYSEFLGKGEVSGDALQKSEEAFSKGSMAAALGAIVDIKMQEKSGARLRKHAIPASPGVVDDEWKEEYWDSAYVLGDVVELRSDEKLELSINASELIEKETRNTGVLHGRITGLPPGSDRGALKIWSPKPGAFWKYVEFGNSGEFRVENVPTDIPLQMEALAFGRSDFGAFLNEVPLNDSELTIGLSPKPLAGVWLRDSLNNQPITEVTVTVSMHKPIIERLHEFVDHEGNTTYQSGRDFLCYSGDGRYAIDAHDYWSDQWLIFSKSGYQPGYVEVSRAATYPNVTELALAPGHGVTGKVLDEQGTALSGALIIVDYHPDISLEFRNRKPLIPASDIHGAFKLDYLAPNSTHFVVRCEDFAPQYYEIPPSGSSITCTLERGVSLTGIVTYDGAPLRKGGVHLSYLEVSPLKGFERHVALESDGSYQINSIRPGRYEANVEFWDALEPLEFSEEILISSDTETKFSVNYDSATNTWREY